MKKILILGGYGFLGSNLILHLLKKCHLSVIVKKETNPPKNINQENIQTLYTGESSIEHILTGKKFDIIINCMVKYDYNSNYDDICESNIYLPIKILKTLYHPEIVFITFNSFYT